MDWVRDPGVLRVILQLKGLQLGDQVIEAMDNREHVVTIEEPQYMLALYNIYGGEQSPRSSIDSDRWYLAGWRRSK